MDKITEIRMTSSMGQRTGYFYSGLEVMRCTKGGHLPVAFYDNCQTDKDFSSHRTARMTRLFLAWLARQPGAQLPRRSKASGGTLPERDARGRPVLGWCENCKENDCEDYFVSEMTSGYAACICHLIKLENGEPTEQPDCWHITRKAQNALEEGAA